VLWLFILLRFVFGMLNYICIAFQMLSLAALCGVPFPTLKVKTLTLETMIIRSVIPGITKLLRYTPGLRKLTIHTVKCSSISVGIFTMKPLLLSFTYMIIVTMTK